MENGGMKKNIFEPLERQGGNRFSNAAIEVRENYRECFNSMDRQGRLGDMGKYILNML